MSEASGFKTLTENLTVRVQRAENRELNVPLLAPFAIASSRLDSVGNVTIRIELSGGCVGWGEAPILLSVTAEDQLTAMVKAREACEFLRELPEMKLGDVLQEIGSFLSGHQFASVRAGMETILAGLQYQSWLQDASNIDLKGKKRKARGTITLSMKIAKRMDIPPTLLFEEQGDSSYPPQVYELWSKGTQLLQTSTYET